MVNLRLSDEIRKPRAVVFDTDNTLYAYDTAHIAGMEAVQSKAMLLLGITLQEFDDAFARARSDVKDKLQGTASSHSRLLYFQKTVELLGLGTKILLTLDSIRSPPCSKQAKIILIITKNKISPLANRNELIKPITPALITPPASPDQVLLGLTFGINLGPLKLLPTK